MVQAGLRIQSHSPHFPQFTRPPTAGRNTYCILNYCITVPPTEPLVSDLCFANTIPSSLKVLSPLLCLENCIHLSRPTWKVLPSFLNFFFHFPVLLCYPHLTGNQKALFVSQLWHSAFCITYLFFSLHTYSHSHSMYSKWKPGAVLYSPL